MNLGRERGSRLAREGGEGGEGKAVVCGRRESSMTALHRHTTSTATTQTLI